MSHYDYVVSREISKTDPPFASLIMSAMRKADDANLEMLAGCWPEIWEELKVRYNAPGGYLPEEHSEAPED